MRSHLPIKPITAALQLETQFSMYSFCKYALFIAMQTKHG